MRVFLIMILVVAFSSCVRNKNNQGIQNSVSTNAKVFEVTEVIQATSYSYLKVKENFDERWVAVSKQEINLGDIFYYDEALEMANFKSKDLDRTFDVIYFINSISKTPINTINTMPNTQNKMGTQQQHSGKIESKKKSSISMKKQADEKTLSDIFENHQKYSTEQFAIKGIVVKVNREVMGRNWIHIQDGTSHNGIFDLTITTQELAEVGDEVTFEGKLTLKKDFGAGYFYDVIMENAVLVKKSAASTQL